MLTRALSAALLALLVLAGTLVAPQVALAACSKDLPNGTTIEIPCEDVVEVPADPDGDDADDSTGGAARECTLDGGKVIECTTEKGTWDQGRQCYASVDDAPPPKGSPIWDGHDEGYIINCVLYWNCPETGDMGEWRCQVQSYWSLRPPGVTGPSPLELARRAVARMQLTMGEVGSTPPTTQVRADSEGLVGVPVWLWVANPSESTTGPIVRSESDGGLTVRAEGHLDRIVWTLADEGGVYRTVTCSGDAAPGTPWTSSSGSGASPTCGFSAGDSSRSGTMTVMGTAYWTVDWAGGGEAGTIDVPGRDGSATILLGEVQVLGE